MQSARTLDGQPTNSPASCAGTHSFRFRLWADRGARCSRSRSLPGGWRWVRRRVLVAAAAFTAAAAARIGQAQLSPAACSRVAELPVVLERVCDPVACDAALAELALLLQAAEVVDRDPDDADEPVIAQHEVCALVWPEAVAMRDSGELLARGRAIRCPVLLLQGECDARPAAAISPALAEVIAELRSVVLPRCGHARWLERHARAAFFEQLWRGLD